MNNYLIAYMLMLAFQTEFVMALKAVNTFGLHVILMNTHFDTIFIGIKLFLPKQINT